MNGEDLRELIERSDLSLRGFAREIDRDPGNISKMCRGRRGVSAYVADQAVKVLRPRLHRQIRAISETLERTPH